MIPFLIIIVGGILIYLNLKAIRVNDNSFKSILKDKEENSSDINLEIIQLRKEIAESLLEVQQEIEEIKEAIRNNNNLKTDGVISEIDFTNIEKLGKTEAVEYLVNNGLTDEEICSKLAIGKGEVLLIKSLLKK